MDLFSCIVEEEAAELRAQSEVQQQTNLDVGRAQIVQKLGLVCRFESSCSFQLEKNHAVNNKIGIILSDFSSTKPHRHGDLARSTEPYFLQGHGQRFCVGRFKKSVPELVVNIVENSDDLLSQIGMHQRRR